MAIEYVKLNQQTLEPDDTGVLYRKIVDDNSNNRMLEAVNEFLIKLSSNKTSIQVGGIDEAIITAEIYNYLGEFQQDYNGIVTFMLNSDPSQVIEESILNGVTSITISSLDDLDPQKITAQAEQMTSVEIEVIVYE